MTREEKELLLKDLCARLPYGVYVKFKQYNEPLCLSVKDALAICNGGEIINDLQYLYLRPMSSMTEEEKKEYYSTMDKEAHRNYPNSCDFSETIYYSKTVKSFDWLNAHHFDYRGLIEKGLALEAPEDMYEKGGSK